MTILNILVPVKNIQIVLKEKKYAYVERHAPPQAHTVYMAYSITNTPKDGRSTTANLHCNDHFFKML